MTNVPKLNHSFTNPAERNIPQVLGDFRSREEVMAEIRANPTTYSIFLDLNDDFKDQFVAFCMGIRGVKMTYDAFFKHIFHAEKHPERLSSLLSHIIGRPLKVQRMLPVEHNPLTEKGSLTPVWNWIF